MPQGESERRRNKCPLEHKGCLGNPPAVGVSRDPGQGAAVGCQGNEQTSHPARGNVLVLIAIIGRTRLR